MDRLISKGEKKGWTYHNGHVAAIPESLQLREVGFVVTGEIKNEDEDGDGDAGGVGS